MRVLQYVKPYKAEIVEVATPEIKPNQTLAKSLACNVSAGTEMAFYRGVAPQFNYNYKRRSKIVPPGGATMYHRVFI